VRTPALVVAAALLVGCNAIFGVGDLTYETTDVGGAGGRASTSSGAGGADPSCTDGQRNGDEVDVDCGGSCPPCEEGALGSSCDSDDDCDSGHCPPDDGVCCDTACSLTCEACLGAKTGGRDGTCDFVEVATDPDGECFADPPETCGAAGMGCSGDLTSCALFGAETVCEPSFCEDAVFHEDAACDGAGVCAPGETTSCSPYVCGNGTCRTGCLLDSHCVAGFWCQVLLSTCQPKKSAGQSCNGNNQCSSNSCSNGTCD
jgi:hypothetical protein